MNKYQTYPFYGGQQVQTAYQDQDSYRYNLQSQSLPSSSQPAGKCVCSIPPFMPANPQLAQAYVPYQQQPTKLFSLREALYKGTIFPELNRPYVPTKR